MDIGKFRELPIMGILRGIDITLIEPLVETICASGLKTIEITINTEKAPQLIKKSLSVCKNTLTVGAGTVLSVESLKEALGAGASFCVTPVLVKEVSEYCVKKKIPVFPGALTPLEIYNARNAGATMVKVFPAQFFGPEYFKEIKGPFNDIELLACGGVTAQNMKTYFANGASAVSFGASVFKKEWLKHKDFTSIRNCIKDYICAYKELRA